MTQASPIIRTKGAPVFSDADRDETIRTYLSKFFRYDIDIDAETLEKWLAALEDGSHEKCSGALRREPVIGQAGCTFCALGVLIDIAYPETWAPTPLLDGQYLCTDYDAEGMGEESAFGECNTQTLADINPDALIHIAALNDAGATFKQIAGWVRDNFTAVPTRATATT